MPPCLSSLEELEVETFRRRSQMSNTSTMLVSCSTRPSSSLCSRFGGGGIAAAAAVAIWAIAAASIDDFGVSGDEVNTLLPAAVAWSIVNRPPDTVTGGGLNGTPAAAARAEAEVSTMRGNASPIPAAAEEPVTGEEELGSACSGGALMSTLEVLKPLPWLLDC